MHYNTFSHTESLFTWLLSPATTASVRCFCFQPFQLLRFSRSALLLLLGVSVDCYCCNPSPPQSIPAPTSLLCLNSSLLLPNRKKYTTPMNVHHKLHLPQRRTIETQSNSTSSVVLVCECNTLLPFFWICSLLIQGEPFLPPPNSDLSSSMDFLLH